MAVISNFGVPVDGDNVNATLMPKLQYRFRVKFINLGTDTSAADIVTSNIISVTRPAITHDETIIETYNSKIYMAGKHTWEPVTVTLRDDVNGSVIRALDTQLSRQVNHADQASKRASANYKFGMEIETLDGNNGDGTPGVLDKWKLAGCFIPNIQYGDLNYGSSDMVQITFTVRYDNASHTIGAAGSDLLSDDNANRSTGDAPTAPQD